MDISIAVIIVLILNIILLDYFVEYCKTNDTQYKWWHIVLLVLFGVFIFAGWFIFNRDHL